MSDGQGRFQLLWREAGDPGPRLVCLEPELVTVVHGLPREGRWLVVVGDRASYSGEVVDAEGAPVGGASVVFDVRQSLFRQRGVLRPWWSPEHERKVEADSLGRFALSDVCGGEHVGLWVSAEGFEPRSIDLRAGGEVGLRVVLERARGERWIEGVVLDPSGAPVEGARVSAGEEIVRTDGEGLFRLSWRADATGSEHSGAGGLHRAEHDTSILRALHPGFLPAEARVADLPSGELVLLRLGGRPLSIRGRLVDERGHPRARHLLWAGNLTDFGELRETSGGASAVTRVWAETYLGADAGREGALTDADGRFELPGLLPREYEVRAYDPVSASEGGPWTLLPGEPEAELVLATEPGTVRVAGRVVTASGRPLEDVWILPRRGNAFNDGRQPPYSEDVVLGLRTDAEGRFEFPALATSGTLLELQHEAFFISHYSLQGRTDLEHLEIVRPILCELQVELSDPTLADALRVLDAGGEELQVIESWGTFLSMGTSARFEDGKTAVLRVSETARTLVLWKAEQEVLRRPLHVDPDERETLRL